MTFTLPRFVLRSRMSGMMESFGEVPFSILL
jgi:hypothetical protein